MTTNFSSLPSSLLCSVSVPGPLPSGSPGARADASVKENSCMPSSPSLKKMDEAGSGAVGYAALTIISALILSNVAPPRTTLREVFLARTHKSITSFPHDAAVLRIVSACSGAFQRYLARPPTRRRWRTAPSDVLSEAPPSGPSSHVVTRDLMSPLVTPSCTIELCDLCSRRCLQRCCSWSMCATEARSGRTHRAR